MRRGFFFWSVITVLSLVGRRAEKLRQSGCERLSAGLRLGSLIGAEGAPQFRLLRVYELRPKDFRVASASVVNTSYFLLHQNTTAVRCLQHVSGGGVSTHHR